MSKHSSYLQATQCQKVDHIPIWLMRQAGRSMKVYRDLRQKYSLTKLFTTPELAAEVTLQPVKAYGVDAAIIFSDILTVPDALGVGIEYHDQKGPLIHHPIQTQADVDRLDVNVISEKLQYVMAAIRIAKAELQTTPLIGFAGSPFTLASYIIGDGKGHDLKKFMPFMFSDPNMIQSLMGKLTQATICYLNEQIKAGVDAIQLFDSWSNVLSWSGFKEFSLPSIRQIIAGLDNPKGIPITVFGTSYSNFYPLLQDIGARVISLDSRIEMNQARKTVRPEMALQGNLDPYFLLASRDVLKKQALSILESMQGSRGYIFNLGHGVLPSVPEENVHFLVDLVQNFPTH